LAGDAEIDIAGLLEKLELLAHLASK